MISLTLPRGYYFLEIRSMREIFILLALITSVTALAEGSSQDANEISKHYSAQPNL